MRRGLTALVVVLGAFVVQASGALAAINVNTTKDELIPGNGRCSLREAMQAAGGSTEVDCPGYVSSGTTTINVPPGTYHLTQAAELFVVGNVAIVGGTGSNPSAVTIDGDGHTGVIEDEGQISISGVTITGGRTFPGFHGDQSFDNGVGGSGGDGGGIENLGKLALTNVIVTGNRAGDGGVGASGTTLANCPGGTGGPGGDGGGVFNDNQMLTLDHVLITNNRSGDGSGGGEGGTSTTGCVGGPGGSGGDGGGLYTLGPVSMSHTTISGNSAGNGGEGGTGSSGASGLASGGVGGNGGAGGGFAIETAFTNVSISSSTIAANQAGPGGQGGMGASLLSGGNGLIGANGGTGGLGGGIYDSSSMASTAVLNSTITANVAGDGGYGGQGGDGAQPGHTGGQGGTGGTGGGGGGIYANLGALSATNVTLAENSAGGPGGPGQGGIPYNGGGSGPIGTLGSAGTGGSVTVNPTFGATLTERNTLISAGMPENCIGTLADGGHNLSFPDTSCPHAVSGDPKLGQLAAYGGLTETMGLGSGSAAINQVPATGAGCPITDQRGVVRPQPSGGACDIGAYEYAPPVCRAIAVATHGTRPVTVQLSCGDPAKLALSYSIVRHPAHGKLSSVNGSKITYTASSGFTGRDQFTYRAVNLNGTSSAQTATVTVAAVPLTISGAHLSKKRFHAGSQVKIQFMLSLAAQVKVTITHLHHGRAVTNGSFSAHERAGKVSLGFDGTVAGTPLAHGSYTAKLVATVGSRKSKPVSLSFAIN